MSPAQSCVCDLRLLYALVSYQKQSGHRECLRYAPRFLSNPQFDTGVAHHPGERR